MTSAAPKPEKGLQIDQIVMDPPAGTPAQPSVDAETQKKLYAETDARFAAQTGVTRKLDPHNAVDQTLIPAWFHVYQGVLAEYRSGKIHWTTDHLPVQKAIAEAHDQSQKAAQRFDAVTVPGAPATTVKDHVAAADKAIVASGVASKKAAAMMPAPHPKLPKLLAQAKAQLAQGSAITAQTTPEDAVTILQAQNAPDHAAAVAAVAPPTPQADASSNAAAKPAEDTASERTARPMPWGPLLGVAGLFAAGVALASRR